MSDKKERKDLAVKWDKWMEMEHGIQHSPSNTVIFRLGSVEILRLDPSGMTYKGQLVEDAGEAHRALLEAMKVMMNGGPKESDGTET